MKDHPIHQHKAAIQDTANPEKEAKGKSMTPPAFQLKASDGAATPPPAAQGAKSGGLPSDLVSGFAASTGHDLSDVNVVRNSDKPAQVGALAYAQGNDIHLAAGQEQHLAHEAAHIVQQREGRVQATTEVGGKPVNDSKSLESEADAMGDKAMQMKGAGGIENAGQGGSKGSALQLRAKVSSAAQLKNGVAQMKLDGRFGEWHDDKYEKTTHGDTGRGATINLRFRPKDTANATKIGLVQTVRSKKDGEPFLPNNDKFYEDRSISKDDAKVTDETTGETDEGQKVDRLKGKNNPVYGSPSLEADETIKDTPMDDNATDDVLELGVNGSYQLGYHYMKKEKRRTQDALLHDAPSRRSVDATKNSEMIFETAALALTGVQAGTYYGSIQWGWRTDSEGNHSLEPFKIVSEGVPSDSFNKSAELWNESKDADGGETANLNVDDVYINAEAVPLFSDAEMKTKIKDLPAKTRLINTLSTTDGASKMRIVDGPDYGVEGYLDETKIKRER